MCVIDTLNDSWLKGALMMRGGGRCRNTEFLSTFLLSSNTKAASCCPRRAAATSDAVNAKYLQRLKRKSFKLKQQVVQRPKGCRLKPASSLVGRRVLGQGIKPSTTPNVARQRLTRQQSPIAVFVGECEAFATCFREPALEKRKSKFMSRNHLTLFYIYYLR